MPVASDHVLLPSFPGVEEAFGGSLGAGVGRGTGVRIGWGVGAVLPGTFSFTEIWMYTPLGVDVTFTFTCGAEPKGSRPSGGLPSAKTGMGRTAKRSAAAITHLIRFMQSPYWLTTVTATLMTRVTFQTPLSSWKRHAMVSGVAGSGEPTGCFV